MEVERVLERLHGVRPNGSGWKALCPAHDDHRPSLSVAERDGAILLKCFTGCRTEDVVSSMRLTMADLFQDGKAGSNGKTALPPAPQPTPVDPEEVLRMHRTLSSEQRRVLHEERMLSDQVIDRYELGVVEWWGERRVSIPVKDTVGAIVDVRLWLHPARRRPKVDKILPWAKGYGKAKLFPLDQLEHGNLLLCAGELDALAAISHGIHAITNTCGEDTWSAEFSQQFCAKDVVVLLDHDDTGIKGTEKRAKCLAAHGVKVSVASWPEDRPGGWDVIDELLANGAESLNNILSAALPWEIGEASVGFVSAAEVVSGTIEWLEPQQLPEELPCVESFEPLMLPEAFRRWIEDISERMQCPPDFPAVSSMVSLAAVVGRSKSIRPKREDDWQVVPNLWGAVVARSGLMKSPSMVEPLHPIHRLELVERDNYDEARKEHEARKLIEEAEKKHHQAEILQAVKEGRDANEHAVAAVAASNDEPQRGRYVVNDTTIEKLGEILNSNTNGVLLYRDELTGFLKSLDKEGREADRAFYLQAWNGDGRFTYDRIGRGTIDIEAACISILGGIQPGPLSQYVRRADRGGADDDGLLQRFQLIVWPDTTKSWQNHDRQPDLSARSQAYGVYERLAPVTDEPIPPDSSPAELPYLHFTDAAQEEFDAWRKGLELRLRSAEEAPLMESHLAKYRSLIPSLALLIHLADNHDGDVGDQPLRQALAWGEYLESHARRVYAAAISPSRQAAKALANRLLARDLSDGFGLRDVYRNEWSKLAARDEVQLAVDLLESLDWLRVQEELTPGRTRTKYLINPRIYPGADLGEAPPTATT